MDGVGRAQPVVHQHCDETLIEPDVCGENAIAGLKTPLPAGSVPFAAGLQFSS